MDADINTWGGASRVVMRRLLRQKLLKSISTRLVKKIFALGSLIPKTIPSSLRRHTVSAPAALCVIVLVLLVNESKAIYNCKDESSRVAFAREEMSGKSLRKTSEEADGRR